MVCIKFTAHPQTPVVSPRFSPMSSEDAASVSAEHRGNLAEQLETSFVDEQAVISTEATSERDVGFDGEHPSEDTSDSENASDIGGRVKIGVHAALAGVSYIFGQSKVTQAHITSPKNSASYFPKGFA
jgi:hypothetical protein